MEVNRCYSLDTMTNYGKLAKCEQVNTLSLLDSVDMADKKRPESGLPISDWCSHYTLRLFYSNYMSIYLFI